MSMISRESELPRHVAQAVDSLNAFANQSKNVQKGLANTMTAQNNQKVIKGYLKSNRDQLSHSIALHLDRLAKYKVS